MTKTKRPDVPTRDRILTTAADLLRRKGYTGTGLQEVVDASEAPFGSIYHFFPDGKEQLGAEAIREGGKVYLHLIEAYFDPDGDLVAATRDFFRGAAEVLRASDYEDACPIATVALEVASASEPMRQASAEVFESWVSEAASRFRAAGLPAEAAREVTVVALELLEGAFLLCRAWRSTEPLESAGRAAEGVVRDAFREAGLL